VNWGWVVDTREKAGSSRACQWRMLHFITAMESSTSWMRPVVRKLKEVSINTPRWVKRGASMTCTGALVMA
jgi:hypothetical protein